MAEESSDRKKISELYFGYSEALKGLEAIDNELEKLNKTSKTVFDNVQKGMENSFNTKKSKLGISNIGKEAEKAYTESVTAQKKQVKQSEQLNEQQLKSSKTMYDKIASYAKTYLIYQGFNMLKSEAKELVNEMVNVEYQMVQIDRVLNDSSLDINKYRDQLIKLAYDYGNSFENVADITLRLAQAGFDAQQSLALTEKTLLALNTAELNATQATSDMVAIMSQWNLMTGDATKVSEDYAAIIDKINKVADNFPTTSEDILNALKKTSSAFNLAGASIDETIAMITTAEIASQRGGKAIGTAMNNIIQQMKETGRLATMEAMGLDIYTDSAKTEFKSIIEIITQLSEKMQELKAAGKENSVEMQQLLSVFTLFRRNVGAGLLSGVAGEDSTYMQVLQTSMNSLGYSMQENEKHMKTAKAAQEQFNATLLELKTKVWDAGGEDVFRSLLLLGTDVTNVFKTLIDTFGTLPTAIGAATLAFSAFQKQIKVQSIDGKLGFGGEFITKIKEAEKEIRKINEPMKLLENSTVKLSSSVEDYMLSVDGANVSTKGYIAYLFKLEAAEIVAKAATIALNVALSMGLSLAITAVISGIDKLIHAEENHIKKMQEEIRASKERIDGYKDEKDSIDDLITQYEELNSVSKEERTYEENEKLKNIQSEISSILKQHGETINSNTDSYEEQIKKLKEISENQLPKIISEYEIMLEKQEELNKPVAGPYSSGLGFIKQTNVRIGMRKAGIENDLDELFGKDINEQLKLLAEWQQKLREARSEGENVSTAYEWVTETLSELNETNKEVLETQEELNKLYSDESAQNYFKNLISDKEISSLEDYKKLLEEIYTTEVFPEDWQGNIEEFRDKLNELAEKEYPELIEQIKEFSNLASQANSDYNDQISILENVTNNYTALTSAMQQYNSSGEITIDTFNKLVNNDLLQYLDLVNGKLVIQEGNFLEAANTAKAKAVADLQEQAAAQILSIAINDLNINLEGSEEAGIKSAKGSKTAAQGALEAAKAALVGATSFDTFNKAMKGDDINFSSLSSGAKKQIDNVIADVNKKVAALNKVTLSAAKSASSGASKAAKSASSGASKAAKETTKTFEEQSQERVKIFKKEIDNLESLEQSWVNKYKKLDLFSTNDLKFITHQRINRYNEYLNQISQLQGISEKDRTELTREYSAKRQEAELEYFDLLKDQLDDQIKKYQEANKERIEQIKDEAQARIDALKKVENANDKIRQKEEYLRKRDELIHGNQGIEYWQQRTGREAQIALAKAQEELEDLDRDWEEKKEGWNLDDQIEEIEKARDAQITAIEEAQEQQIAGWKAAYEAQVQLYAQTGQIIYDDSIINAGYLYNAYMDNFVTPFHAQIQNVVNSINQASAAADNVINKMNTISGGGGSTRSVSQAVQKNTSSSVYGPSLNTPISPLLNKTVGEMTAQAKFKAATSTISLPKKLFGKFHGGGKVGSQTEAFALLRPNEVVLTPEWAKSMGRMMKYFDNITEQNLSGINNNSSISVEGNLINIEANIKNRSDVNYLEEKLEKMLKDKFNIRK